MANWRGVLSLSLAGLTGLGLFAGAGCESLGDRGRPPIIPAEKARERARLSDEDFSLLGYRRDWTGFPGASRGLGFEFIDPFEDVVILQDLGSTITAVETTTGEIRWRNTLANPLTDFVGNVRTGNLLHSSSEAQIFTLDLQTGNLVDRQTLNETVSSHPVLSGGLLVYGTPLGRLMAHYLAQDVRMWGNTLEGAVTQPPVLIGDSIGAVSDRGGVIFVNRENGRLISRAAMYEGTRVPPAASDAMMYVASLDHSLYAFAPGNPRPVWRKRTGRPLGDRPVYHAGSVYCTLPDQGLTAFFADSGTERWSNRDLSGYVVGMREGRLLVWDGTRLSSVDPERGDVYDSINVPNVDHFVLDRFEDGNLYAVSDLGVVTKFIPLS